MVFSSLIFLFLFLPACLILYFLAPGLKVKNIVLLVFSLVFYAWGEPFYVLLLIASAAGEGYCNNYDDIQMSDLRFESESGNYVIVNKEEQELYEAVLEIVLEAESSGKFAQWLEEATELANSLNLSAE